LANPVIALEWVVPPVVEKVLVIDAYDVPAVNEYLQVADSLVERDMLAWVVPADRVPEGLALDLTGAVVSVAAKVFPETTLDMFELLPASSAAMMAK
jgi:hypothetical protein